MWRALALAALLAGCGVKQAPIAPKKRPIALVPAPGKMDCSPTDETCDREDPHYVSHKTVPSSSQSE